MLTTTEKRGRSFAPEATEELHDAIMECADEETEKIEEKKKDKKKTTKKKKKKTTTRSSRNR